MVSNALVICLFHISEIISIFPHHNTLFLQTTFKDGGQLILPGVFSDFFDN